MERRQQFNPKTEITAELVNDIANDALVAAGALKATADHYRERRSLDLESEIRRPEGELREFGDGWRKVARLLKEGVIAWDEKLRKAFEADLEKHHIDFYHGRKAIDVRHSKGSHYSQHHASRDRLHDIDDYIHANLRSGTMYNGDRKICDALDKLQEKNREI